MYVSIFLFGVAQALMLQNWVAGFSGLVTFVPLFLPGMRDLEERPRTTVGPAAPAGAPSRG